MSGIITFEWLTLDELKTLSISTSDLILIQPEDGTLHDTTLARNNSHREWGSDEGKYLVLREREKMYSGLEALRHMLSGGTVVEAEEPYREVKVQSGGLVATFEDRSTCFITIGRDFFTDKRWYFR